MSAEAEAAVENALEEGNEDAEDEDIEAMKRKVAEIEAEYERLKGQNDEDLDDEGGDATVAGPGGEGKTSAEADPNSADITKSIFIGNLDDSVTPENLQEFFKACGTINRITIMCDKFTGQPKGFAYMEFEETEAVELACGLDETEMNGKPISVKAKRQNVPRFMVAAEGDAAEGDGEAAEEGVVVEEAPGAATGVEDVVEEGIILIKCTH
eukprot:CAMPEP_0204827872 /NCGR_PEP_ID=MMETSP1346-20131115/5391_1 /ASSEMBLY_ACC=CAM_ASM_000771 /TAXON_ID=215587 /ORGANISM="Aplanochytrium stocchinoi, Strain GSBS06" /LENGTH=210 /DNA_ID=CAMNT_0051956517 /DNA_START=254 /DNA_END=887 /DNA_ORIENTATION=-